MKSLHSMRYNLTDSEKELIAAFYSRYCLPEPTGIRLQIGLKDGVLYTRSVEETYSGFTFIDSWEFDSDNWREQSHIHQWNMQEGVVELPFSEDMLIPME